MFLVLRAVRVLSVVQAAESRWNSGLPETYATDAQQQGNAKSPGVKPGLRWMSSRDLLLGREAPFSITQRGGNPV
jgi:hypothetical protein